MDNSGDYEEILRKKIDELFSMNGDNVKVKGKGSICSTCKHFNGKTCRKGFSFAGFATKLSDCNGEWEICNTGYNKGDN